MQVIGFCRFSYPALGGFQVEHGDSAARKRFLYDPVRMEARFRQFEALTLPSIAAQTDTDFTFVILVGDDLPGRFHDRLRDMTAALPQVRIVARPPGPHRAMCQEVINAERDLKRPCLQFRHDDDDALAVTYVARLRAVAGELRDFTAAHRMVAVDFNRGYVARADAAGLCAREVVVPFLGVALALAVQPRVRMSVMNFAHTRINRFMPAVSLSDGPMYVRGHNAHNDSRQKAHVAQARLPRLDATGEARFLETFNISADAVRRIFADVPP